MKLDVIIPVGPGHEGLVNEAIYSVKMACLTGQGPFTEVKVKAIDDTKGELGRSKARNTAIEASKADWLFFLDADDLMHPDALLRSTVYLMDDSGCGYDAVWGQITEYKDVCIVPRFQIPRIDDLETLVEIDPYYTLQMGFFVKREKMPLFDEEMNTGEDWKVYLELWKTCKCVKQHNPLMINRRGSHSQGPKSAHGGDWRAAVMPLIEAAKAEL